MKTFSFSTAAMLATVAIGLGTLLAPPAHAQQTISLTVVAGHPPVNAGVAGIRDFFIPEVDRRLAKGEKYKINWTQAYAGSVADTRGVLDAVQKGIGDLGYVPHLFNADKLPMEQFTYLAPFGTHDTEVLMKIVTELHDGARIQLEL
jgi:TRAP-type mannitol/chloroaromatic compound transport system substrate-binding protein